jgi:glycosyltransferase involved in cell wall biosynthesis
VDFWGRGRGPAPSVVLRCGELFATTPVVTSPSSSQLPLVAVVTPAFNGAEYLAACLESVRAQTYQNWIHLVVDNASTDATRQIAESFAARDARVTVLSFHTFLPMLENFNRALGAVRSEARYLKLLLADDTLHPACLSTMVAAAERERDAALVVSRFYLGSVLSPANAPDQATRLSGPKVAKDTLLGTSNVLGTPSVQLMRIDRLVGWPSIFPVDRFPPGHPATPPHNQGDKEACLDTLERADVVFLPEPLVFLRDDGPSATGFARRVGGWHATRLDLLLRRGARFMDKDTLRKGIRRTAWKWTRAIAWRSLKQLRRSDPDFWLYQSLCLDNLVPRLREAGYASEATMLASFQKSLARFAQRPDSDTARDS